MAMNWWRAHHGLPYDAKLGIVARALNVSRADVGMVWVACLDHASQAEDRGSVAGINPEVIAFGLDMDIGEVSRIIEGFRNREMIDPDGRLAAWDKRQPKYEREDRQPKRAKKLGVICHAPNSAKLRQTLPNDLALFDDVQITPQISLDTDTDKKRVENPVLAIWETFKRLYPAHRLDEERACQAMLSREDEAPQILAGLRAAVTSPDWTKDNGQYVPRASGFISDGRYKDFRTVAPKPVVYFDPKSITG